MPTASIITFANKYVTPLNDAIVYQGATMNGVYADALFTIKNTNQIHVNSTYAMLAGRHIDIYGHDANIPIGQHPNGGYGQLYLNLDLSNRTNPVEVVVETADTLSGLNLIEQNNPTINTDNGSTTMTLCVFGINSSGIYNIDDAGSTTLRTWCPLLPTNANYVANKNIANIIGNVSDNDIYSPGDLVIHRGQLKEVTDNIQSGDVVNDGVNVTPVVLSDFLAQNYVKSNGTKQILNIQRVSCNTGSTSIDDKQTGTCTGTMTNVQGATSYFLIAERCNYGFITNNPTRSGTTITVNAMNVSGAAHTLTATVIVIAMK